MTESNNRKQALAQHLDIDDIDDVEVTSYDDKTLEAEGGEYLVLTDSEADDVWEERLDSYIEECVLPEIPEHLRNYFDGESWKDDARYDGRGHAISSYDGNEEEEDVEDETFYIFRVN